MARELIAALGEQDGGRAGEDDRHQHGRSDQRGRIGRRRSRGGQPGEPGPQARLVHAISLRRCRGGQLPASLARGRQLAERKNSAAAPDAERPAAADPAGLGQGSQLVIDGAADPRLDPRPLAARPHQQIGRRMAGQEIVRDPDRVLGIGRDDLVDIGAKGEPLVAPAPSNPARRRRRARPRPRYGLVPPASEPVAAVRATLEHAREQADQLLAADRTAPIKPRAVAADHERQVAAFERSARTPCPGHHSAARSRADGARRSRRWRRSRSKLSAVCHHGFRTLPG